jgi:KDO2-lipid IV(A) lauroyltransferase
MEDGWLKNLKWRIEAWAHSAVAALFRQLPAETVFVIGEFLGRAIWPFMRARRNTIARNLRIAGAASAEESAGAARISFIRSAANLMCSSVSANMRSEEIGDMLEVENPEMLVEAAAKGRGVMLLLAHMGNWEMLTRLQKSFDEGVKIGGFYRPLNNPILNERVLRERQAYGARMFSKRDSLHQVSAFLRNNGVVGILADQRVGIQGELVPFFGRLTRASPVPSLLARRCKSEVLALSFRTVAPGKWSARYHAVEKPHTTANCMAALEQAMRISLTDVFWLQERWKIYAGGWGSPVKWIGDPEARGSKPHRVLVWAKESEKDLPLPPGCLHPDIIHEYAIAKEIETLESIDLSKPLPIDYILTFSEHPGLGAKADELGIPIHSVSTFSE